MHPRSSSAERTCRCGMTKGTQKAYYRHRDLGTHNPTEVDKLTVKQLASRVSEMDDCQKVDSPRLEAYHTTGAFYTDVIRDRMTRFLKRHHLMSQFVAEDAAGER